MSVLNAAVSIGRLLMNWLSGLTALSKRISLSACVASALKKAFDKIVTGILSRFIRGSSSAVCRARFT